MILTARGAAGIGKTELVIMGIDPGLASTGVGVIASGQNGEWKSLFSDHVITSTALTMPQRLERIHQLVQSSIAQYHPEAVSIESIFFAKNVRSAVMMAHGRGAAILAASQSGVYVQEYPPLEIKQSVVGKGRAGKEQVRKMIAVLLKLSDIPTSDHETDALACALCHAHRIGSALRQSTARAVIAASTSPRGGDEDWTKRKELLAQSLSRPRRHRR
ncbi:hypothetical protein BH09SUM1_BH09SUM1_07790 [soil metagenome]